MQSVVFRALPLYRNKVVVSVPACDVDLHGAVLQSVSHPGSEAEKGTNV